MKKFSLLTWNVFLMMPLGGCYQKKARAADITIALLQSGESLLCLQKVFDKSLGKKLSKGLIKKYPFQIQPQKKSNHHFNSGLWIGSKFPLSDLHFLFFKNSKGMESRASKGATGFTVKIKNKSFQIINCHFLGHPQKDKKIAEYDKCRDKQFSELKTFMAKIKRKNIPQIIVGDFFVDKDSSLYTAMRKKLNIITGDYKWASNIFKKKAHSKICKDRHDHENVYTSFKQTDLAYIGRDFTKGDTIKDYVFETRSSRKLVLSRKVKFFETKIKFRKKSLGHLSYRLPLIAEIDSSQK